MNSRLEAFFEMTRAAAYAELPSEPHISITKHIISSMIDSGIIRSGMKILDIGCGQGLALETFAAAGITNATGITLGPDFEVCLSKHLNVFRVDQNNMQFPDKSFDFIWARHVLEHSPIPLFTLFEYRRILATEGTIYIEVPAPGTPACHELNDNHYSVLTPFAWTALFKKAGFKQIDSFNEYRFDLPNGGTDRYFNFFLERETES